MRALTVSSAARLGPVRAAWRAFAAVLVLLGLATLAPQAASAAATGSISGTVTAGGSPLKSGFVTVYQSGAGSWVGDAQIASDGKYTVPHLAAGSYVVQFVPFGDVGGTGFLSTYHPAAATRAAATPVAVADGAAVTGIDGTLAPGGAIEGKVSSPTGSGLGSVDVVATDSATGRQYSTLSQSTGAYRINGIPTGSFKVKFSDDARPSTTEWWKDATSVDAAKPVAVTAGAVRGGINATLGNGSGISGRVTDTDGAAVAGAHVYVVSPSGGGEQGGVATDANGRYDIGGLVAGIYYVRVEPPAESTLLPGFNVGDGRGISVTANAVTTGIDVQLDFGGAIAGKVIDHTGAGVAGVYVGAYTGTTSPIGTTTAADGTYKIKGLAQGSYRVLASGSTIVNGYYPGGVTYSDAGVVTVTARNTTAGIDYISPQPAYVKGKVTNTAGDPIPSLYVAFSTGVPGGAYSIVGVAMTASDGTFTSGGLRPGSYYAWFSPPFYSSQYATYIWRSNPSATAPEPLVLTAGQARANVDAVMRKAGSIAGKIGAPAGSTLSSAYVTLYDAAGVAVANTSSTGVAGAYSFGGVAAGTYRVGVQANLSNGQTLTRYYPAAKTLTESTAVTVAAEQNLTGIDIDLPVSGTVRGTVTGPNGPVAGASVGAYGQYLGYTDYSPKASAITNAQGQYSLPSAALAGPPFSIKVTPPVNDATGLAVRWQGNTDYSDEATRQNVDAGDSLTIDVALVKGAAISGTIRGSGGVTVPAANVTVQTYSYDPGASVYRTVTADAEGRYKVGGLAPGEYRLAASDPKNQMIAKTRTSPVVVTEGQQAADADLTLLRGATVRGKLLVGQAPAVNAEVTLIDEARQTSMYGGVFPQSSTTSGADGTYTFQGVKPGRYRVRVGGEGRYLPVWFDGATGAAKPLLATALTAVAGQTVVADMTLKGGAEIFGTVRNSNGAGMPYIQVTAYAPNGAPVASVRAEDDGVYAIRGLPDGSYRMGFQSPIYGTVYSGGASTLASATLVATSAATGTQLDATIAVPPPAGDGPAPAPTVEPGPIGGGGTTPSPAPFGTIKGKVTVPAGKTARRARLYFRSTTSTQTYWSSGAIIPASGEYSFMVSPGDYQLMVIAPSGSELPTTYSGGGSTESSATTVHVTSAQATTYDLALPAGTSVTGRVTGPGNVALPDVSVVVWSQEDEGPISTGYTDESGNYRVAGLPAGRYKVSFYDPDDRFVAEYYDAATESLAKIVTLTAGGTATDVNAVLDPAGSISGTVVNAQGDLVRGADGPLGIGALVVAAGPDGVGKRVYVDLAGRYLMAGLAPGSYDLRFIAPGGYVSEAYSDKPLSGASDPVQVTSGAQTQANAELAAGGSVSGKVVNEKGAGVWARVLAYNAAGALVSETTTGYNGLYMIGVPAGAIRIAFTDALTVPAFATQYYPAKATLALATPVSVALNSITDRVDATISGAESYFDVGGGDYPTWRTGPIPTGRPDFSPPPGDAQALFEQPLAAPGTVPSAHGGDAPAATPAPAVLRPRLAKTARLRMTWQGRASIDAICPPGASCRATVRLTISDRTARGRPRTVELARSPRAVAWSGRRTFSVQLPAAKRAALRRARTPLTITLLEPGATTPADERKVRPPATAGRR